MLEIALIVVACVAVGVAVAVPKYRRAALGVLATALAALGYTKLDDYLSSNESDSKATDDQTGTSKPTPVDNPADDTADAVEDELADIDSADNSDLDDLASEYNERTERD